MDLKFLDDIDCESFFEHVEDLIDFPLENNGGGLGAVDFKDFGCVWEDTFAMDDPFLCLDNGNSELHLSTEIVVRQPEDMELEWLSTFPGESFADGGMRIAEDDNDIKKESCYNQFQISSPISVLESSSSNTSSSSSGGNTLPLSSSHRPAQRARSKRSRSTTMWPREQIRLIPTSLLFGEKPDPDVVPGISSESEYIAESHPVAKSNNPDSLVQTEKKKLKLTFNSAPPEMNQNPAQAVRKCMHCEITKTPQWRAGPMGPKTLCNACGVRYKSGRLFPEYRPAASPTFIASVHSNSHKRVIEMRNNSIENGSSPLSGISGPTTSQPPVK